MILETGSPVCNDLEFMPYTFWFEVQTGKPLMPSYTKPTETGIGKRLNKKGVLPHLHKGPVSIHFDGCQASHLSKLNNTRTICKNLAQERVRRATKAIIGESKKECPDCDNQWTTNEFMHRKGCSVCQPRGEDRVHNWNLQPTQSDNTKAKYAFLD